MKQIMRMMMRIGYLYAALAVIDRIDAMKKAVLAKAFRGELGTNDETEMPVEVCL